MSAGLSTFERYLSLWVGLCIVAGIALGNALPGVFAALAALEVARVNLVVAVLIWVMIFPMMVNVDFASLGRIGERPKGLAITLVVNWLVKPFTMLALGWLFLDVLFRGLIPPDDARQYLAGMILLGAAPCTAMVFVWSQLTRGDATYTLVQVSVNDLVMIFAFAPLVALLLGVADVAVPWSTLLYSVGLYVVIPLAAGWWTRRRLEARGSADAVAAFTARLKPYTVLGLLGTVVLLFAFQGPRILAQPLLIALIAAPLVVQSYGIFAVAYLWAWLWKVPYPIAAPAALIGTSNFFELAVAVAISLFGLESGAALATVVGVLVEVPVMLSLVAFANRTQGELRAGMIPYAGKTIIALEPGHFQAIQRTVALLDGIAHSAAYQAEVDDGADALVRFEPGNRGVFMGYDFHLSANGPRLIEINTNAGGALLNGLHTAALCDPQKLACLCSDLLPVETIQARIVGQFVSEFRAARGPEAELRSLVIADDRPAEQFLFPEFELMEKLFALAGIHAEIRDTSDVVRAGEPLPDLVYLRDTDFTLASPRTRALRAAYLAGDVVVTPAPREHHLLANKRRLALFSSPDALVRLGVAPDDAAFLARTVPETRLLAELGIERAWAERREWVFKPCAAYGSKAVYRGDKVSRRKLEEIVAEPGYLAQRRVEPGEVEVDTLEGARAMKFDVRAYAYRDQVLLLGARVYQGQVTNLRSPGGGFSAICVSRATTSAPIG